MPQRATGSFTVQITPLDAPDVGEGSTLGRYSVAKQFAGDLDGTSTGQMLTAGGVVRDSAVYVVIERVSGTLHGKRGAFALAHKGVMTRGVPEQNITVVPDSGSGELTGIAGSLTITIADGQHGYQFDYTID